MATDEAGKVVAKLWTKLDEATPVKDPIAMLERLAGSLEQMTDVVGDRVNTLNGKVGAGTHLSQLRAEVLLLERLLGHLRGVGTDMARLGLAERHIELQQAQADLVIGAARAMLDVLELLPADRDRALRAFLSALGRGPVVAGEVVA